MKPVNKEKTLDERVNDFIRWGDWEKAKRGIDYMKESKVEYPNLPKYEQQYEKHIAGVIREHNKRKLRE